MAVAMAAATATEGAATMSDRLTVLLPPAVSQEEREQAAISRCHDRHESGDGWGDSGIDVFGYGDGVGCGTGDGDGGDAVGGAAKEFASPGDGFGCGVWYVTCEGNGYSTTIIFP